MDILVNLLAMIGGWPVVATVLATVLAIIVAVVLIDRLLVKKPTAMKIIIMALGAAGVVLKSLLGDRWIAIYDAVIQVVEAAADGDLTQDEAVINAKRIFDGMMVALNIPLNDVEKDVVHSVIEHLVKLVVANKPAALAVFSSDSFRPID